MKRFSCMLAIVLAFSFLVSGYAKAEVTVEFCSTDNEEDRVAVYESVAAKFTEKNPGIMVKIVPIEEGAIVEIIGKESIKFKVVPV